MLRVVLSFSSKGYSESMTGGRPRSSSVVPAMYGFDAGGGSGAPLSWGSLASQAALLILPPYSPDLNPIEMIFAKLKHLLRSLECRTRDGLWRAMQSVLDQVTAADAANCFRHCGYTLQTG
jgi:hypothetical protein